jgi:hypothetical protein
MPLRNGKEYLLPFTCPTCENFIAHEVFGFRCSACSITDVKPPPVQYQDPAWLARLKEWVDNNTFDGDTLHARTIFKLLEKQSDINCYRVLHAFRRHGVLLKASDALKLIRAGCGVRRGHIIASCVRDWWNIKTARVGGEWPSYLTCYYGRFDSPWVPTTLPVPARGMLSCTETMGLERIQVLPLTRPFARTALRQGD